MQINISQRIIGFLCTVLNLDIKHDYFVFSDFESVLVIKGNFSNRSQIREKRMVQC